MGLEKKATDSEDALKVIEWEDLEQELARLWSLSSTLNKAKEKKADLREKLESLIQVRSESLNRSNELEEMRQKLEYRRLLLGKLSMRSKAVAEEARNREEQLSITIRSLLVSGKALSVAFKQLQEANRLLAGERGHLHLKNLQKMQRVRLKHMVGQVSVLYPVKAAIESTQGVKLEPSSMVSRPGNSVGSLAILGLRLNSLPLKKASFFSDKKEIQRSATALGYVAHAVSLIASYLDVPLRYPLRMGGSRSYINDYASSIVSISPDSSSNSMLFPNSKPTEFPLFLEGQDTTRATYAIFLLNKDLEQLLNFIGIQSLGPRHLLANLKELFRTIQSSEYIDKLDIFRWVSHLCNHLNNNCFSTCENVIAYNKSNDLFGDEKDCLQHLSLLLSHETIIITQLHFKTCHQYLINLTSRHKMIL